MFLHHCQTNQCPATPARTGIPSVFWQMVHGMGGRRTHLYGGAAANPLLTSSGGWSKSMKPLLLAAVALAGAVVLTGTAVHHATAVFPMQLAQADSSQLVRASKRPQENRMSVWCGYGEGGVGRGWGCGPSVFLFHPRCLCVSRRKVVKLTEEQGE